MMNILSKADDEISLEHMHPVLKQEVRGCSMDGPRFE